MTKFEIKKTRIEGRFQGVADAFKLNFSSGLEKSGSQLCIFERGQKVVELVGKLKGEEYNGDATQVIMSSGKVVTSFVAAYLVDQGKLKYDSPLVNFLPEFELIDPERKEILVEDILRHDAGLAFVESRKKKITFDMLKDEERFKKYLSTAKLFWNRKDMQEANKTKYTLGKKSRAYHAKTRGFYMNEICKTVSGRTIGRILKDEVEPLVQKNININCGIPDEKAVEGKPGNFLNAAGKYLKYKLGGRTLPLLRKAFETRGSIFQNYSFSGFEMNPLKLHNEYFELECPSFGMTTNAVSLATLTNAMLFQDKPILSAETQQLMFSEPVKKYDFVFNHVSVFDKGGFCVFENSDFDKQTPGLKGFRGWGGYGGSLLIFHPEKKLVFSYIPSHKKLLSLGGFMDERCLHILDEFFRVI
eukprot:maker-scaffold_38-snap-gene-2.27-mRNA-1 protein AED:0.00 eAED:0.00 QI:39/1/1/1/0/0.5/2/221/415